MKDLIGTVKRSIEGYENLYSENMKSFGETGQMDSTKFLEGKTHK